MHRFSSIVVFVCSIVTISLSQPILVKEGVRFSFSDHGAKSVSVVSDFNGWSKDEDQMGKEGSGSWSLVKKLSPGAYQYKFVVDGARYENDPLNPVTIPNYNNSGKNSIFVLTDDGTILLTSDPPAPHANPHDVFPKTPGLRPVYLNIIWHQHQPLYVNPEKDQLQGPWVRTHSTKDYYDMAAMLRDYPDIHCNINLTSSLLHQLREYYLNRLGPFVDVRRNTMNVSGFLKRWKGRTDPWIDLALKPTAQFTASDKTYLFENIWNAFGVSEVMIERFPEYAALKRKLDADRMPGNELFSEQEMREIKFWFYLAHFDPDFLKGSVKLTDGSVCDLSSFVEFRSDGRFYLKKRVAEVDCLRLVVESYKVMANVIPIHRALRYDPVKKSGQVDVITTPYYHPILPLIYDSDLARICQPNDQLPPRYSYPQDANAQVVKAVKMYKEIFGTPPTGMWPGEGSVAQSVLPILRSNGILWTASDMKVLARSEPKDRPNTSPYRFSAGTTASGESQSMALVFRDTELSDRIGFKYQNYKGEEAAEDFIRTILSRAPRVGEDDVLVTVILDGENAWEWYRQDIDGKEFLHAFYRKLSALYKSGQVITTTTTEYLIGNPGRNVPPHAVEKLPSMASLWPGSWINANYDTWIGEEEENHAWEYLLRARQDLERTGLKQPDPGADPPKHGTRAWYTYSAWESMYAAEGSDWFWWYGSDQSAPAGDTPFDDAFRIHLNNMYKFARLAGASIKSPGFDPIIITGQTQSGAQGVMAQSRGELQGVTFVCDATTIEVPTAIYIVGNIEQFGEWVPNLVRMYDDGTHGDKESGDGLWSLTMQIPVGEEIQYKFTNSGKRGEWIPGEEFPSGNRLYRLTRKAQENITIQSTFGHR